MRPHTKFAIKAAGAFVALIAASNNALAQNTSIRLETVSNYQFVSGGSTINDTDANTEGQGFWSAMLGVGTGWTAEHSSVLVVVLRDEGGDRVGRIAKSREAA